MTSDELKAAAERLISCNGELEWKEQYEGNENHDFNDDVDDVAKCFLARLAADEQQYEYIATLERERDEARELLREIAACSDEHVGLNYVTKQIPTYFLIRIGNAIKVLEINQ